MTRRMHSSRMLLAAFRTTPRAPRSSAATFCASSMAAVGRIVRTAGLVGQLAQHLEAGCRGIARSSSRMSGFRERTSVTAS